MTPRNAFNPEGLNPLHTTLRAGLLAAPGLMLTGLQYGWAGLVVGSMFTAWIFAAGKMVTGPLAHRLVAGPSAADTTTADGQATDAAQLQTLCDTLTARMDMPAVRVILTGNDHVGAETDSLTITVSASLNARMDDGERAFMLVHELDHIRSKDTDRHLVTRGAWGANIVLTTLGLAQLQGWTDLPIESPVSANALIVTSVITFASLGLASNAVQHLQELRSDGNAVRLTGSAEKGISMIEKSVLHLGWARQDEKLAARELERHPSPVDIFYYTHPAPLARAAHMRRIEREMTP